MEKEKLNRKIVLKSKVNKVEPTGTSNDEGNGYISLSEKASLE